MDTHSLWYSFGRSRVDSARATRNTTTWYPTGRVSMAQKVTVELVDDLDGTASDDITTVSFALDGVSYEIDLNQDNASNLRTALADVIAAGRRVGGRVK